MTEKINHPSHYNSHPSGVECITVAEHMSFNLGNVMKYIWRADFKDDALEDLKKAKWYLDREIEKREGESNNESEKITIPKPSFFGGGSPGGRGVKE